MKIAVIFLFIGIILLIFFFSRTIISMKNDTIDLHVHDTYIVISYLFFLGFNILFLGLLFSLGGLIGTGFSGIKYWLLFILFASLGSYYIIDFFKLVNVEL